MLHPGWASCEDNMYSNHSPLLNCFEVNGQVVYQQTESCYVPLYLYDNIEENTRIQFAKAYPSFFKASIAIDSEIPLEKMAVYDVLGREYFNREFKQGEQNLVLETSNWNKGFYFIKLQTREGFQILKVVKE